MTGSKNHKDWTARLLRILHVLWIVLLLFAPRDSLASMIPLNRGYEILENLVKIRVEFNQKRFRIQHTLKIKMTEPALRVLELDAEGLEIHSIHLGEQKLKVDILPRNILVHLPKKIPEKVIRLVANYSGSANEAVHFTGPTEDAPNFPTTFYVMGEPSGARKWILCDEHPARMSIFHFDVTVPDGMLVLTNGNPTGNRRVNRKEKTQTFSYRATRKISPQFTSVTAGEFDIHRMRVGEIEMIFYYPPPLRKSLRESFQHAPDVLEFYRWFNGSSYPFSHYAGAVVPDYPAGALENPQATTYDVGIIHHRQHTTLVHEWDHEANPPLADWNDLWINEGKATFAEALYALWRFRKDGRATEKGRMEFKAIMMDQLDTYTQYDSYEQRAMVDPRNTDSDRLFDPHSYDKASWVYRMLYSMLGEENFLSAIHRIQIEEFKDRSISTKNVQEIFEQVMPGVDLTWFFQQWVYRKGYPKLEWYWEFDPSTKKLVATVNQYQRGQGVPSVFRLPLDFLVLTKSGRWKRETFVMNHRNETFTFGSISAEPKLVLLDPDRATLATHTYADWPRDKLLALVRDQTRDWVAATQAMSHLPGSGKTKEQIKEEIQLLLGLFRDRKVFSRIRGDAAYWLSYYSDPEIRPALLAGLSESDPYIRTWILSGLSRKPRKSEYPIFEKLFLDSPSSDVALAMASSSPQQAEAFLLSWIRDRTRNPWKRAEAIYGLQKIQSVEVDEILHDYLGNPDAPLIFKFASLDAIAGGGKQGFDDEIKSLTNNPNPMLRTWAISALSKSKNFSGIAEISHRAVEDPLFDVRLEARYALAKIIRALKKLTPSALRKYPGLLRKAKRALQESEEMDALTGPLPPESNSPRPKDITLQGGLFSLSGIRDAFSKENLQLSLFGKPSNDSIQSSEEELFKSIQNVLSHAMDRVSSPITVTQIPKEIWTVLNNSALQSNWLSLRQEVQGPKNKKYRAWLASNEIPTENSLATKNHLILIPSSDSDGSVWIGFLLEETSSKLNVKEAFLVSSRYFGSAVFSYLEQTPVERETPILSTPFGTLQLDLSGISFLESGKVILRSNDDRAIFGAIYSKNQSELTEIEKESLRSMIDPVFPNSLTIQERILSSQIQELSERMLSAAALSETEIPDLLYLLNRNYARGEPINPQDYIHLLLQAEEDIHSWILRNGDREPYIQQALQELMAFHLQHISVTSFRNRVVNQNFIHGFLQSDAFVRMKETYPLPRSSFHARPEHLQRARFPRL